MGAQAPKYIVSLAQAVDLQERMIGGKAAKLARLAQAGVRVPDGFCVTSAAYERFVQEGDLVPVIQMELGRKPLDQMRWEEIWDAALRLRSAFLNTPIPTELVEGIGAALERLGLDRASRSLLPPDTRWMAIEGGNHAQFGWYGSQSGDCPAALSRAEQQAQIVRATLAFLEELGE